jgi:hypothetical protein
MPALRRLAAADAARWRKVFGWVDPATAHALTMSWEAVRAPFGCRLS